MSDSSTPPTGASPRLEVERFAWVEVFRGLAILEVLVHHVSGRFLREVDPLASDPAFLLLILNRTLHFAVPGFLLLTTVVLGASLLRSFDLRKFAVNRLGRLVWPYLLWSGVYLIWRYFEYPAAFRPELIPHQLVWGKSFYHLYFLAVALQLTLLIPLLRPVLLRRWPFWKILLAAVVLTLAVYLINRYLYRIPYTGSFVLWYLPSIALGIWLVGQLHRLEEVLRRGIFWAALVASVGLALYLPLAVSVRLDLPINTFQYQAGNWLFTAAASYLLLALAAHLSSSGRVAWLKTLGRYSMQIYLVHPMVIRGLEVTPRFPEELGLQPAFLIYLGLALLIPLGLAILLRRLKLSRLVFGR
jgi:surface polysaccharide O-acyltransferase-like enzyme